MINSIKNKIRAFDINLSELYIIGIYFMSILISVLDVFDVDRVISLLHAGIYVAVFGMLAINILMFIIKKRMPDALTWIFLLLVTAMFSVITFNFIIKNGDISGLSAGYYSSFVFFVGTLTSFYNIWRGNFRLKCIKIMVCMVLVTVLIFTVAFFAMPDTVYMFQGVVNRYLTFNMVNPNKTAMALVLFFGNMFLGVLVFNKRWQKFIFGLGAVIVYIFLYKTISRTVWIVSLGLMAAIPFFVYWKKVPRLRNSFWSVVFLAPILFAVVYILCLDSKIMEFLSALFDSPGKSIFSRANVWKEGLEAISKNVLWGNYFEEKALLEHVAYHNLLLWVLGLYGAVAFTFVCVYMNELYRRFNRIAKNRTQKICILIFGVLMFLGLGESLIFSGSTGLFVLLGGFLAAVKACSNIKLWNESYASDGAIVQNEEIKETEPMASDSKNMTDKILLDSIGLRKIQMEILRYTVDICDKNSLTYYFCGGSTIGAVRHKGYIPWDDDIDIIMPRADYDKLIDITRDGEIYRSLSSKYNKDYYYPFVKIVDLRTELYEQNCLPIESMGVCIDVFPLDYFPNAPKDVKTVCKKYKLYRSMLSDFAVKEKARFSLRPRKFAKFIVSRYAHMITWQKWLKKLENVVDKYSHDESPKYLGNIVWGYAQREMVPVEAYGEGVKLEFEGGLYNCPKDYDTYLRTLFGDYMKLPPEEQRVTHHGFAAYIKASEKTE